MKAPEETQTGNRAGLAEEINQCRRCDLWRHATNAVAGEGPANATIMLIGEQPGDREDIAGRPFVGPAGQLLDEALIEAGIIREEVYVTNAVKHFKFEPRGKRRIHRSPSAGEITACRWWLDKELRLLHPRVIIVLGASAARAVLRRPITIGRVRGQPITVGDASALVTVHPSYLLRITDPAAKARERTHFIADLRIALVLASLAA